MASKKGEYEFEILKKYPSERRFIIKRAMKRSMIDRGFEMLGLKAR